MKMTSSLSESLRRTIEHSQKARRRSEECRKKAEELIAEAERLFTTLELSQRRGITRIRLGYSNPKN